jgi:hypothetical protein
MIISFGVRGFSTAFVFLFAGKTETKAVLKPRTPNYFPKRNS